MKSVIFAAFFLLLPLAAGAMTPQTAPVAALDAALISTMKAGSAAQSFQARYAALEPVVVQNFNLPVITQNSVGFLWNTLPPAQQQQLAVLFKQFTVASYVSQFGAYNGEQINLLPAEKDLGPKKIVETQIVPSGGGSPTEIDYVVGQGDSGWLINDILLNGTISQVAVHSSDFSALVTSGDATQLIAALKSKIATLSNGAAPAGGQ